MNNLTQEQIDEVEAALEKVTPGEWEHRSGKWKERIFTLNRINSSITITYGDTSANIPNWGTKEMAKSDAAFIALAKNLMPALIAAAKEGLEARAIKEFPESYQ